MSKLVSSLTNEAAVAHQSGAMEADTISKNGRFLKSQMSKIIIFKFVLLFSVVLSFGVGFSACGNANAQGSNSNALVRWEYKITYIIVSSQYDATLERSTYSATESQFNELGKDGWEFVGFASMSQGSASTQIFKRRLP